MNIRYTLVRPLALLAVLAPLLVLVVKTSTDFGLVALGVH